MNLELIHNNFESKDSNIEHFKWNLSDGERNVYLEATSIYETELTNIDSAFDIHSLIKKGLESLKNVSLTSKEAFKLTKNFLLDLIPDTIHHAITDKYIDKFVSLVKESVETSKAGAILFCTLSQNRLLKPIEQYEDLDRGSFFEGQSEAKIAKILEEKKLDKGCSLLEDAKNLTTSRFKPLKAVWSERRAAGGDIIQTFHQSMVSEDKINVIEERVTMYKGQPDSSHSTLFIHNTVTGKTIDVGALLPGVVYLAPGKLLNSAFPDNEMSEADIPNIQDLHDYYGFQNADINDFFATSRTVSYGNLFEKGGILSVLHEIAHTWHKQFRHESAGYNFKEFYNKVYNEALEFYIAKTIKTETSNLEEETAKLLDTKIKKAVDNLEQLGVTLDTQISEEKMDFNLETLEGLKITTEKLTPLIETFVASERDAWAHAIRILRFYRDQGIDLAPELKTNRDIYEVVHEALRTYQENLDYKIRVPKTAKKFTSS